MEHFANDDDTIVPTNRADTHPAFSTCGRRLSADDAELLAVRSRFCGVIARWRLTQGELGGLLGCDIAAEVTQGRVLPDRLDVRGETALRLLVRADNGLEEIMPEPGAVARWLREPARAYGGATPLQAMCDLAVLRAIVRVIEGGPRHA